MEDVPAPHETATSRPALVQLSVPEDLYEDVIEFIADRRRLRRSRNPADLAAMDALATIAPRSESAPEPSHEPAWDAESLRGLLDQANDKVVRALVAVARARDRLLSTDDITGAAGLQPGRAWGGFLSRAHASARHRWGRTLPLIYVDSPDGRNRYRMDESDARVIEQWADENGH
jgi:hypothetical protein